MFSRAVHSSKPGSSEREVGEHDRSFLVWLHPLRVTSRHSSPGTLEDRTIKINRFLCVTSDISCKHQRRNDEGPLFSSRIREHELPGKSISVLDPAIALAEGVGIKRHQSCTALRQLLPDPL